MSIFRGFSHWNLDSAVVSNSFNWTEKKLPSAKHFPGVIIVMVIGIFCIVSHSSLSYAEYLLEFSYCYGIHSFFSLFMNLPYEISSFTWKRHNIIVLVSYTCCVWDQTCTNTTTATKLSNKMWFKLFLSACFLFDFFLLSILLIDSTVDLVA